MNRRGFLLGTAAVATSAALPAAAVTYAPYVGDVIGFSIPRPVLNRWIMDAIKDIEMIGDLKEACFKGSTAYDGGVSIIEGPKP